MKSLVLAGVLLAGALSAPNVRADTFECVTNNCVGQIITAAGAVIPVAVPHEGVIRLGDAHTFVGTGGTWVLLR